MGWGGSGDVLNCEYSIDNLWKQLSTRSYSTKPNLDRNWFLNNTVLIFLQ